MAAGWLDMQRRRKDPANPGKNIWGLLYLYEGRDMLSATTLSEEAFAIRGTGVNNRAPGLNTPTQVPLALL